jgi:hypothetical protein
MLHKLAIHSCNGEYIIIVVAIYVHEPELEIIPSRTFILKTWIQIAIRLLKQVQVIHKLMIRIAFTTLPTMGNTKIWSAFFPSVSIRNWTWHSQFFFRILLFYIPFLQWNFSLQNIDVSLLRAGWRFLNSTGRVEVHFAHSYIECKYVVKIWYSTYFLYTNKLWKILKS